MNDYLFIENQSAKHAKIFLGLALLLLLYVVFSVIRNEDEWNKFTFWLDKLIYSGLVIVGLKTYRKASLQQFVEWDHENINFRLKGQKEISRIKRQEIEKIKVGLDIIEIELKNGNLLKLNFVEFTDLTARKKIKERFESEKQLVIAS